MSDRDTSRMVEVGDKDVTEREATGRAVLRTSSEAIRRLQERTAKGDPIEAARVAGLMAVKRTPDLLPFCHPIAVTGAEVRIEVRPDDGEIVIEATVRARDRTGVEMEALTACAVAALSIYDTAKAFQREATIAEIRLVEKRGGASGHFRAP
ncbi:MAG TPA: cyclic pyranopterin monophosphate synthase MoaC [Actinomycetota bacterium]|nr:cyclic pyranopterin monophosphate synthase MoaC [Actinomycetota bacterium]